MKHLELHILQSLPVSCVNRDDMNSPKTAMFGGAQRARVSSQCWKRAIRERAKELSPLFQGERTRLIVEPLQNELAAQGISGKEAEKAVKELTDILGKLDAEAEKKGVLKVKTLLFTTPSELRELARQYAQTKDAKKAVKNLKNPELLKDAADVALFGRMVARDHSLTIEGAAMFAHALSTHRSETEIDFFSAVDDCQSADESGAGMTGVLEYNSAVYYRFIAVNLGMLSDAEHLSAMTRDERKSVMSAFIQACLTAVPAARKNSMHAATLPGYVLGIVREAGHPVQLVNAFEVPASAPVGKGLLDVSIQKLNEEFGKLESVWGLGAAETWRIPDVSLAKFLDGVCRHVD